ncbi:site-specific tyrosine recombinase XerC [Pseudovibrio sp. Ad5]|uniref:tyrosine-type recombinase/integrase n=1 Tax=Pseudovibrio sp. Ad5 TaxID=989436 RepID=UPI0007B2CD60|nr:tyrosine-type recombinase/integrase [Pseudovibrio sp. Ad5]KZK97895.1 site-specific tyrosine recombinase XerC [Pseudovibrio sp. Ad5]
MRQKRKRLPYILREVGRGKVFWYFRRGKGPRSRLPGEYGSEEFMEAYTAALNGADAPPKKKREENTLGWLIDQYLSSPEFSSLKESTQAVKTSFLNNIAKESGHHPLEAIDASTIQGGRDKRASTPGAANNFLKHMSAMYKWAISDKNIPITKNPTRDVPRLRNKSDGHHTWMPEEVEQYRNRWPLGTRERLALEVLAFTGLRRGDVCRVGPAHVKDGVISFSTEKGEVEIHLPILPPLQEAIDATPHGVSYIGKEDQTPYTKESFGNWFRECCVAAGVPGRAHGMRKAAATLAAENGATDSQLKAIFGWTTDDMPSLYTRKANRKKMAEEAIKTLQRNP